MNIISNYNLSIYPRNNKQQSKTNPNFGINATNVASALSLGIPAAGIFAAQKLMKFDLDTVRGMNGNPAAGKKVSGSIDLPVDELGFTKLHHLCLDGNFEEVKHFLDENPDINLSQMDRCPDINLSQMDRCGCTYMQYALKSNNKDIINLIANMDKYDPTVPDKDGWTDLHFLCGYGYAEVVKTLLEKHPEFDINQQTKEGFTCMVLAAHYGNNDLVNLIAGMDKYNPTIPHKKSGQTDLDLLLATEHPDVVKTILEKHPEYGKNVQNEITSEKNISKLVDLPADHDGWTELHHLCKNGDFEAVKKFLSEHQNINLNQKTYTSNTYMSLAARYMHNDIVNLIAGMDNYDPTIPDDYGWTDFHILCEMGYTEAAKTLFAKHPDFDINRPDKAGLTCMRLAINNTRRDLVNFIAGMDKYNPMIPNKNGDTDMAHLCSKWYYADAIKKCCEKHPYINLSSYFGKYDYSYLGIAIRNKNRDYVKIIAGMDNYDPTIPDLNGFTGIHRLCEEKFSDEAIALLEKHRMFNINQQNRLGVTCMGYAISNNDEKLINYIAGREDYDPTITTGGGWTDLHRLCCLGYTDIVDKLFAKHRDFDINKKTEMGYTCLSLAEDYGHDDIVKIIKKYFPSVNTTSINRR